LVAITRNFINVNIWKSINKIDIGLD
jgi:hypothetical protein